MDNLLKVYYNPSNPGSFGGVKRLAKATGKNARNWVKGQDAYTLHKPVRVHFPRRKVIALDINELLQADLVDMQKYARVNRGNKYILTVIDCFSKKAWVFPIKKKSSRYMLEAFKKLFKLVKPKLLHTDQGKEFFNKPVQEFFKKHDVRHYITYSGLKASIVERFNRSLKGKMWRMFTKRGSYKYLDVLQDLVDSYNNSKHSSIKRAPNEVKAADREEIFNILYPKQSGRPYKYKVGDTVRISKNRATFAKGYQQNWTDEVFIVDQRKDTIPRTYVIRDLKDNVIQGGFYEQELQLVDKSDNIWAVEKVLKRRGKKILVKWKGFDPSHNSWVTELI